MSEKQIRRVMRRLGVIAVYTGMNLSREGKKNRKYPYLLKGKVIRYPNQVWSTDITYIRLPSGNVYFMAIIDWFSHKVLNWLSVLRWMQDSTRLYCVRRLGIRCTYNFQHRPGSTVYRRCFCRRS
jgi:transposase InsO family protein